MNIRYSLIIRAQTNAPHFHLYKMAALRVMRCRVVQVQCELFCGGSPLTLRPNFKSEKGSVTAAAAACMPRRGIFADRKMLYLRVMHCRTVQVQRELFSFFALKESLIYKLANAIKIKLPTCTSNISKNQHYRCNNRRWQAPGGQRGTSEFHRTVSTRLP